MTMMGLTSYLKAYEWWFWMIRFFVFPYLLVAFLIALFLFSFLPRLLKTKLICILSFIIWFALLGFTQIAWQPVMAKYNETEKFWQLVKEVGTGVGEEKKQGKILVPEGASAVSYCLVRLGGIRGKDMVSQMYDPFFYMEEDPFADWPKTWETLSDWFKEENINWFIYPEGRALRYRKMIENQPDSFQHIKRLPLNYVLYQVNIQ
jgi:hypothetical protein